MEESLDKLGEFYIKHRPWVVVLLQGYGLCLVLAVIMGTMLYASEGESWWHADHGAKIAAEDASSWDECVWFVFTVLHGEGFGEFMPRTSFGHFLAVFTIGLGMWCQIVMMAIIMLSQLQGQQCQNTFSVISQILSAALPSYLILIIFTVVIGAFMGPYISDAPAGYNHGINGAATGIYWMFQVTHRAPFGDLWPDTYLGRYVAGFAAIISYLYPPCALALIAAFRPRSTHETYLEDYVPMNREVQMCGGY